MLGWALTFLVIALIAAVLGFGGIAGAKREHRGGRGSQYRFS